MLKAFFSGLFLALGLILPLGIQNIFVFNQGSKQKQLSHALPTVITATICDAILIIGAVLGVSTLVIAVPGLKTSLLITGFFFLIYMGIMNWSNKTKAHSTEMVPLSVKGQIFFSASVSLLNPHALIDTVGVIGTNALQFNGNEKLIFMMACIFISACWFFGLSVCGYFLQQVDKNGHWMRLINQISAIMIWIIAAYIGRLILVSF